MLRGEESCIVCCKYTCNMLCSENSYIVLLPLNGTISLLAYEVNNTPAGRSEIINFLYQYVYAAVHGKNCWSSVAKILKSKLYRTQIE